VLPPPLLHVRVSTRLARSLVLTGAAILVWFFAPAGCCDFGTGFGQLTSLPSRFGPAVAPGLGAGLGPVAAVAGSATSTPPPRTAAAVTATRAGQRTGRNMPMRATGLPSPARQQGAAREP
jgi:hypothetical protein